MPLDAMERWKKRKKGGRFPQSLIIMGEKDLATELAKTYLCEGENIPCGHCIHCRKVAEGIHPDIQFWGEDGESLKVEAVRKLRSDAYVRPNEAERKIYVIEAAEKLNASGQNALLKLLEEGPAYAVFFFLVKNPEALLPTLRSRCELLRGKVKEEEKGQGKELCALLSGKIDKLSLATYCVGLEKKKREELILIVDDTIEEMTKSLAEKPADLVRRIDVLEEIRRSCETNIGAGHVAGWLLGAFVE